MANAVDEKQEILLEAGTNELEVLIFRLQNTYYGVNVAKVREVIGQVKVVEYPMRHPAVAGVFKLRDSVIPLVDLMAYFEPGALADKEEHVVILMEFNNYQVGFIVDSVERIYRLGWDKIKPMPSADTSHPSVITSVCHIDDKMALMVDFEKITFDLAGRGDLYNVADEITGDDEMRAWRSDKRLLLAEDSGTIRGAIEECLQIAGYAHLDSFGDGQSAWDHLEAVAKKGETKYDVVVTDIEMPRMDGLHLCKRIKEHPQMKGYPCIIFSSLVSDTNIKKCMQVGADAAITKPQMSRVVDLVDRLLKNVEQGIKPGEGLLTLDE